MFERDIIGTEDSPNPFGDLEMAKVTKRDIRGVVEPIVLVRHSPVAAGHTLRLMRQFFSWVVDREDDIPMPGFPRLDTIGAADAKESDRYLSPEEIGAFWRVLDTTSMSPTIRSALRLLLLLGVRSGELLLAEWTEFDLDEGKPRTPDGRQGVAPEPVTSPRPATGGHGQEVAAQHRRPPRPLARPWGAAFPTPALVRLADERARAARDGARDSTMSEHAY